MSSFLSQHTDRPNPNPVSLHRPDAANGDSSSSEEYESDDGEDVALRIINNIDRLMEKRKLQGHNSIRRLEKQIRIPC